MKSIKVIKKMINKHLYNLNKIKYYNDENADLINTINILIISNSLNFPDLSGVENMMCITFGKSPELCYTGGGKGSIFLWTNNYTSH